MYIYIAGPYSKPDPVVNTKKAIQLANTFLELGHDAFVPHLTMFWHLLHPQEYERWLKYDFNWILRCEALFRMEGESPGADREVAFAKKSGIRVFYHMQEFHSFIEDIPF